MVRGEAGDAGGLAPAKDGNKVARLFPRRTLSILELVDYRQGPTYSGWNI